MQFGQMKKAGPLPDGGVTVWLRGGRYALRQTFKLGAEDAGTAAARVVYRAYAGEKPVLMGCKPVTGFRARTRERSSRPTSPRRGSAGCTSASSTSTDSGSTWPAIRTSIRTIPTAAAGPTPTGKSVPMYPDHSRRRSPHAATTRRRTPGRWSAARRGRSVRLPALQLVEQHRADRVDRPREAR